MTDKFEKPQGVIVLSKINGMPIHIPDDVAGVTFHYAVAGGGQNEVIFEPIDADIYARAERAALEPLDLTIRYKGEQTPSPSRPAATRQHLSVNVAEPKKTAPKKVASKDLNI